jgi:hypothetical protein
MARQRLYVVWGTGPDAVGLVGRITNPVAAAGGNIVDFRQDVLHGKDYDYAGAPEGTRGAQDRH